MRFFKRLAVRRALRLAHQALATGRVLAWSFQPTRGGKIHLAKGQHSIRIRTVRDKTILALTIDGKQHTLPRGRQHDKLLAQCLRRIQQEADLNLTEVEKDLPEAFGIRMKRLVSVTALRIGHAIKGAKRYLDRRERSGFGTVLIYLQRHTVEIHTIEDGKLPAIRINGREVFTALADIKFLVRSAASQLRILRRAPVSPTLPKAA